MPHPIRKIYNHGSPGFVRKLMGVTLSAIKKHIAAADDPTDARRKFVADGLLGVRK